MTGLPRLDTLAELPVLDGDDAGLCIIDPDTGLMVCDLPASASPSAEPLSPTLPQAETPARPTGDSH